MRLLRPPSTRAALIGGGTALALATGMSLKVAVSAAILVVAVVAPLSVRAEPAPNATVASPADSAAASSRRWYGWQTLVADGAAVALGAAGFRVADEHTALGVSLGGAGVLGYTLAAPAVHWAHDRPSAAALSLAVRVGLPLLSGGLLMGPVAGRCASSGEPEHEHFCDRMNETLWLAVTLSAVVASSFDAAVLGWAPHREAPRRPALAPLFAVVRGGASVGLDGAF